MKHILTAFIIILLLGGITVFAESNGSSIPSASPTVVNVYCCCPQTTVTQQPIVTPKPTVPVVQNTVTNTVTVDNTVIINEPETPLVPIIIDKSHTNIHNNIHPKFDIKVNNHNKK